MQKNINNRNFILKASSLDDLDRFPLQGNFRVIPKSIILEMNINIGEIISLEDKKIYRYESGRYWPEEAFTDSKSKIYSQRTTAKYRMSRRVSGASKETSIWLPVDRKLSLKERRILQSGSFLILSPLLTQDDIVIWAMDSNGDVWKRSEEKGPE